MSRRPEPQTPVAKLFERRAFVTASGVVLTWEALSSGLEAINRLHDAESESKEQA